jgi:tRNA 2-selenouridine synthase
MSVPITDFLRLRGQHPLIDVRSPDEFKSGFIPGAVNIPLLNNEERIVVGTAYKQQGQHAAIREGFRLVGPRLNEIIDEAERISQGKEILVHCWRGGMRSNNFCQFVAMAGIKSRPLSGGYKAYRKLAMDLFKMPLQITLLTGCTGSGKTEILQALAAQGEQVIDLEKLAAHKGSAFGGLLMPPQPTTEQFQNELFEVILKMDKTRRVWIEDESMAIGKIFLPGDFWAQMMDRPLIVLDVSREIRVQRLSNEYGDADRQQFLEMMNKIVKKLGGQHYLEAKQKLLQGDLSATIAILLTYYDKAYLESINRRKDKVILKIKWDGEDAIDFAKGLSTIET